VHEIPNEDNTMNTLVCDRCNDRILFIQEASVK
jgi:hypothetical protein